MPASIASPPPKGRQMLTDAGALVLLTFAAYLPALRAGFVWDDNDHVPFAPFQRTVTALKWVWIKLGTTPQYYPLTHTTFWIESHLWGLNPAGYHAVNILLQAGSAILLSWILRRLDLPGAWVAAAIFAVHPVNVESVAWITERKNTLSGFFYLLAFGAALRAWNIDTRREKAESTRIQTGQEHIKTFKPPNFSTVAYAGCLLGFIAALLSKTVASSLPAALLLVIWWKRGRLTRRDALMAAPMFVLALAAGRLTSGMEVWNVGAKGPEFAFSTSQRILIAGRAIWFYAGKILWPAHLAFIYPRWQIDPRSALQWIAPAAVIFALLTLWLLRRRIGRGPLAAAIFFVGTLFPALGFVNVYPMRFSFVADHFQYLAEIGLIVLVVAGFKRIPLGHRAQYSVSAVVLAMLTVLSFEQCRAYQNADTLWLDTLNKNPDCWLAMDNLSASAESRGQTAEAIGWLNRSLAIHPHQPEAHFDLGRIFARQRLWDAADGQFHIAMQIAPDESAKAEHELALLFADRGDFAAAASAYANALAEEPNMEPARLEYASLLWRHLHQPRLAAEQYEQTLTLNPDSVGARAGLATILHGQGDIYDALDLLSEAVAIDPSNAVNLSNYGSLLVSAGRPADAAEAFRRAIADDPRFAPAYDGLGRTMIAEGNTAEAMEMFRKAVQLNPDFSQAREDLDNIRK